MKVKWNGFECQKWFGGEEAVVIAPEWYDLITPSLFEVTEYVTSLFDIAEDVRGEP